MRALLRSTTQFGRDNPHLVPAGTWVEVRQLQLYPNWFTATHGSSQATLVRSEVCLFTTTAQLLAPIVFNTEFDGSGQNVTLNAGTDVLVDGEEMAEGYYLAVCDARDTLIGTYLYARLAPSEVLVLETIK